jgi:anti-sigma regulatory factor (Ser/Thr protein kinase)
MTVSLPVSDASYVSAARRDVEATARRIGLPEDDVARATLVASELATNLARHGGGGHLLVRPMPAGSVTGLELIAVDRGRGMADVRSSLRDGTSTGGTSGTGLGAIQRQSDEFDIFSVARQGTVVLARVWPRRTVPAANGVRVGVVNVPKPEEEVCGDSWGVTGGPARISAMIADGLGHGPLASQAAQEARRLFMSDKGATSPVAAVQKVHAGLQATRGAAVGVVSVDLAGGKAVFSGIGNIAGLTTAGGQTKRFVSMNGIAGHAAERFQEFVYPCDGPGLVVVLHSDGLSSNWSLDKYAGLAGRDPGVIAAVLYRDASRGRDDATVLVMKRAA